MKKILPLIVLFTLLFSCETSAQKEEELLQDINEVGGLRVTIEPNTALFLTEQCKNRKSSSFQKTLEISQGKKDYINSFVQHFQGNEQELINLFNDDKGTSLQTKGDVELFLKDKLNITFDSTYNQVKQRLQLAFNNQFTIQKEGNYKIIIELPNESDIIYLPILFERDGTLKVHELYSKENISNTTQQITKVTPIIKVETTKEFEIGYTEVKNLKKAKDLIQQYNTTDSLKLMFLNQPTEFFSIKREQPMYQLYALKTKQEHILPFEIEQVKQSHSFKDQFNRNTISIDLNKELGDKFFDLTSENIDQPLGVVINNQLYSCPTVLEPITEGRIQISGQLKEAEARNLSVLIQSEELKTPVIITEKQRVEPK